MSRQPVHFSSSFSFLIFFFFYIPGWFLYLSIYFISRPLYKLHWLASFQVAIHRINPVKTKVRVHLFKTAWFPICENEFVILWNPKQNKYLHRTAVFFLSFCRVLQLFTTVTVLFPHCDLVKGSKTGVANYLVMCHGREESLVSIPWPSLSICNQSKHTKNTNCLQQIIFSHIVKS